MTVLGGQFCADMMALSCHDTVTSLQTLPLSVMVTVHCECVCVCVCVCVCECMCV